MIRRLLQYLLSNEMLIQKLADSYPIRRAAQLTAYMFHRGKEVGEQSMEKMQESEILNKFQEEAKQSRQRLDNFKDTFTKELKEGFSEMKEEMKKKR